MTEATSTNDPNDSKSRLVNLLTIFVVALRLGLTSFGGPIAHIGFFRQEYVENRRWLSERRFSDLVALCHFLPGPTSSQVGIAVGITRGGLLGGVLAWIAFTAPSAALLIAFGFGITEFDNLLEGGRQAILPRGDCRIRHNRIRQSPRGRMACRPQDRRRSCRCPSAVGHEHNPSAR